MDKTFPVVRVFGTIGWIVAGIFIGVTGVASSVTIFKVAAASSVLLALYSLTLPHACARERPAGEGAGSLLRGCVRAAQNPPLFVFSVCAMLISVPLGTYYAYTASYLADAGMPTSAPPCPSGRCPDLLHAGHSAAVPPPGVKVMLLIGMLAWFVRYAMFALGVSEEGRILLYLGILLHGVCYDFFFVVGFIYTDRVAGEKVKGQAQSMIVMFTYGIGMLLGSQISGALYNRGGRADRAAGVGDILVDPGGSGRGDRADFPSHV